ncbi:hypothetical protein J2Y63_005538 [Shinella sp. BE166]
MKNVAIKSALDDALEILAPTRTTNRTLCKTVCLYCERADQPMGDDGCGICDDCLGLSVGSHDLGSLEFSTPSPHFTGTARNR